jgi:hypothetical protein
MMGSKEPVMDAIADLLEWSRHHFAEALLITQLIYQSDTRNEDALLAKER